MESWVAELQRKATDSDCKVSDLLRHALVVARKLQDKDFEQWIKYELDGYPEGPAPEHRFVTGEIKVLAPYKGWSPVIFPEDVQHILNKIPVSQKVSELESLLKEDGKTLKCDYRPEVESMIRKITSSDLHFTLQTGKAAIEGILDCVRNKILDWAITLEERGIPGEGMTFLKQERAGAGTTNIHIANFQGNIGNIANSAVTQNLSMTVSRNDFESLKSVLNSHGVSQEDITDLKSCLDEDPTPVSGSVLGEKVGMWIGKMVGKAESGAWSIGVGAAGTLLTEAIKKYCGL